MKTNSKILNQQKIWDKIAEKWNKFRKKKFKFVEEFLKNKKGQVLDLGCGSGRNFIKSENLKFYGVDFSEKMLEFSEKYAQKNNIDVELKKSDASDIPYENNFFDAVLCVAVLHCIESKLKREKVLQEIYRVLKQDCKALISVWSKNSPRVKNKPKEARVPWNVEGKKYYRYYYIYEKQELENELKKTGFKILKSWEGENIVFVVGK